MFRYTPRETFLYGKYFALPGELLFGTEDVRGIGLSIAPENMAPSRAREIIVRLPSVGFNGSMGAYHD